MSKKLFDKNDLTEASSALTNTSAPASNFISTSGMYDVKILCAVLAKNSYGARSINFMIEYEGNKQIIFGLRLDNNNLMKNKKGHELFIRLLSLATETKLADIQMEEADITTEPYFSYMQQLQAMGITPPAEITCIPELENVDITMAIQEQFNIYNDKIRRTLNIKEVYRKEDKAHTNELVPNALTSIGTQYQKDLKYADKPYLQNNLTMTDIEKWKADKNYVPAGYASTGATSNSNVEVSESEEDMIQF